MFESWRLTKHKETIMKLIITVIAIIIFAVPAAYSQKDSARPEDDAAIRQLIQNLEIAWAQGSGEKWADNFTDDVDYTVWNGMYVQGRDENLKGHQMIFDTIYKGTAVHFTVSKIKYFSDSIAVVHFKGYMTKANGERALNGLNVTPMAVLTKTSGKWLIAAFQNTPVIKPGELVIDRKPES